MSVSLLRANALALPLADASVDLVVTSPPYFGLRSYQDGGEHYAGQIGSEPTPAEFVDALLAATREMVRVLKPSGSIFVNLGDRYAGSSSGDRNTGFNIRSGNAPGRLKQERSQTARPALTGLPAKSLIGIPWRYALRCIDELGLILRAEVIWSKPNGLPESVTDRVRRSHEQWFHFTLAPRYFADLDPIREEYKPESVEHARKYAGRYSTEYGAGHHGTGASTLRYSEQNPLGKLPGSVWTVPTEPLTVPDELGVDHFAAFPTEWPRRIIQGWSPIGGVVLDPFGGTGTTALVADVLGRHGISVDMSGDYCRLAQWRTTDPGQRAKAARVEAPPEIPDGQLALFEDGAA